MSFFSNLWAAIESAMGIKSTADYAPAAVTVAKVALSDLTAAGVVSASQAAKITTIEGKVNHVVAVVNPLLAAAGTVISIAVPGSAAIVAGVEMGLSAVQAATK